MPLNLYKRIGETPLERLDRLQIEKPEYKNIPLTYAGRLDPMAEGVLLVLVGEECKEKDKYLDLDKVYEGEIVWGFETDTYDVLGKITGTSQKFPNAEEIKKAIENLKGKHQQKYPPYSSKPVQGKPLFQWAREGKLSEISEMPTQEIEIYNAEFLNQSEIASQDLLENISNKISKVNGDFRQLEIINGRNNIFGDPTPKKYMVTRFKISCSSGTYIRSLVNDLGNSLGSKAILYSLIRTSVGDFKVEDSER